MHILLIPRAAGIPVNAAKTPHSPRPPCRFLGAGNTNPISTHARNCWYTPHVSRTALSQLNSDTRRRPRSTNS